MTTRLQEEEKKILTFFSSNKLVANPSKTAYLLVRPNNFKGEQSKVSVGDSIITESESESPWSQTLNFPKMERTN